MGGNAGQSLAPLLTRWIFIPFGLFGAIGFTGIAAMGIAVQLYVARWYGQMLQSGAYLRKQAAARRVPNPALRQKIAAAITILILLVFVRSWYVASIGSFMPLI